jgi:glyoxylase-like metal-dependent hydrolase (beta-lactamase superfamily II)
MSEKQKYSWLLSPLCLECSFSSLNNPCASSLFFSKKLFASIFFQSYRKADLANFMIRRSHLCVCNLTRLTNAKYADEQYALWNSSPSASKQGIPRKSRLEATGITILHDTPQIVVAGRNRCNHFGCNQFLIACKKTGEALMIDATDDWMDDWIAFARASHLNLKYCFLTHCHLDNIINLCPLVDMWPTISIAWCRSDKYWVENFHRCCQRYQRLDMMNARLPIASHRPQDVMLTASTNRTSSFLLLGDTPVFYVSSPGHSMGHMMLSVPQEKLLFSGDLIYHNGIGRVDLPYASGTLLAQSLRQLEDFPDNTVVMPGHGRLTTLGRERRANRGLQRLYELISIGKQEPSVGFNDGYL